MMSSRANPLADYLALLQKNLAAGHASEGSHYPTLKNLQRYLEDHLPDICNDMKKVLVQKLELILLARTEGQIEWLRKIPLQANLEETEIIIYLIDYNHNSKLKRRAEETGKPNFRGKVRIAFGGLALWQANLTDFGDGIKPAKTRCC